MQTTLPDFLSRHRGPLLALVAETHQAATPSWHRTLVRWFDLAASDPATALSRPELEDLLLVFGRLRLAHSSIRVSCTSDGLSMGPTERALAADAQAATTDLLALVSALDPDLGADLRARVRTARETDLTAMADILRRRLDDAPRPPAA